MNNSKKITKAENIIVKALQIVVFLLFMMMVVLVFAQVFVRFFTQGSLVWSEELSRYLMIWMVYMASVLTYAEKRHIIVDAFINVLKGLPNLICQILSRLCVLAFIVIVTIGAVNFLPTTYMQKSPANGIVMTAVYVAIPISLLLTGLISINQIIQVIREYRQSGGQKGLRDEEARYD